MNKRAFTLMEIVMVLVILAMLAAIIYPKYVEQQEQATIDLTRQNLENFRLAIDYYFMVYEYYPSDLNKVVFQSYSGEDRKFIKEIPLEAITDSRAITYGHSVDGAGGWLWDDYYANLKVNLFDHPTDPRRKYSEW